MHKKKSAVVHHRRWFSADCYLFPSQKVLPMYLLYLCIKKSQRSTIGDGSPLTACLRSLNYSLFRCTTHVPFVLVQNTSQRSYTIDDGRPAFAVLSIPFSDVLPMYLLYLCIKKSQRSTIGDGSPLTACLRRLKYSLLRCTTHVPFVLVQNTSQRSYTIDDGRPAFAVLCIPFSDVLPMYLLYLCKIQVSGRTPSTMVLR